MTELRPKKYWRWWSTKTYPNGQLLPRDMTRLYFSDGEAYMSIDVSHCFAKDTMFPELAIEKLIKGLREFKEKNG